MRFNDWIKLTKPMPIIVKDYTCTHQPREPTSSSPVNSYPSYNRPVVSVHQQAVLELSKSSASHQKSCSMVRPKPRLEHIHSESSGVFDISSSSSEAGRMFCSSRTSASPSATFFFFAPARVSLPLALDLESGAGAR